MPGDVAVEGPDAGVVSIDLPDHVAVCGKHLHVAALRVRRGDHCMAIPCAETDVLETWFNRWI